MKHQENTLNLIFSIVDDFCNRYLKKRKRRKVGRKQRYTDNQILKMVVLKHLSGIQSDRSLIRICKEGLAMKLFKTLPDHSRFNRRTKELTPLMVRFQRFLTRKLKTEDKLIRIIDSTALPVVNYWRSYRCHGFPEANYGYCAAKKEKYYGFKLHLLTTVNGIPTDYDLTPASIPDGKMTEEMVDNYGQLILLGDMGYLNQEKQNILKEQGKTLITPFRKNQKRKNSQLSKKLLKFRRRIETVFSQLKEHMHIEKTKAKSLCGLATRVTGIIFSFTLGIYVNSILGRRLLEIKSLLV